MRIISGTAGGITLKVPNLVTRPTTDQVREAVFSMIGDWVVGAKVLDLFAGSGAYGLEALSRGAAEALFVEQNVRACEIIRENLTRGRLDGGRVLKSEAFTALRRLAAQGQGFDLIFADPPYAKDPGDTDYGKEILSSQDLRHLLVPGGCLVLECMVTKHPGAAIPHWTLVRDRSYGSTRVLLLQLPQNLPDAEIPGAADLQSPVSVRAAGHDAQGAAQDEGTERGLG